MTSWTGGAQNSYSCIYFPHKNYLHKEISKDCRKWHGHLQSPWHHDSFSTRLSDNLEVVLKSETVSCHNLKICPFSLYGCGLPNMLDVYAFEIWDITRACCKTEKWFLSPEDPVYCWPHEALGKPKRKTHCHCRADPLFPKDWPARIALR